MLDLMKNEAVLNLVVSVAVVAWGIFKGSSWYKARVSDQQAIAVDALARGAFEAYRAVTKPYKDSGKKLPAPAKEKAREFAIEWATRFASAQGVDIQKALGEEFVTHYLEQKVNELGK